MTLISRLKDNRDGNIYPFHMPGHKRMSADDEILTDIYGIDISEIRGFDDLHNARGILKEAEEKCRQCFDADETHFLVNGSTGGILAAVCGTVTSGDNVIVAANCHRSVYNAVMLSGAALSVITPENEAYFETFGGIDPEDVARAIDKVAGDHRIAVVITSPTYEGITSDIKAISGVCHSRGAVLIVDSAHGAHLGFSDDFPQSAISAGADVVITSVHKTLPAMTQTALIHINGNCLSKDRIRRMLSVFMTSSPSYVFMSSIDSMTELLINRGKELFTAYSERLDDLYKKTEELECLSILRKEKLTAKGSADHDKGKIVVRDMTGKLSGSGLYDLLYDRYDICAEMATDTHVILMTSIADTDEGFKRLYKALCDIDKELSSGSIVPKARSFIKRICDRIIGRQIASRMFKNMPDTVLPDSSGLHSYDNRMKEALFEEEIKSIPVELSEGRTAKDLVTVYPPGIPVTIPGNIITADAIDTILCARSNGLQITGLNEDEEINVIWERSST